MGNVINIQQSGGLGQTAKSNDGISGMALHVPAPSPTGGLTYQLGGCYKLGSSLEAEALAIDDAFDLANGVNAYQTILEFFTINPKGTLYIQCIDQDATLVDMLTPSNPESLIKLVNFADGKIKQLGVTFNYDGALQQFEDMFEQAVPQAQLFAEHCAENNRPLHVVLEGYGLDGSLNLKNLNSNKVSVFIGQNRAFYGKGQFARKHCAIGTCLGVISAAQVNESIGYVGNFNVQKGNLQIPQINEVLVDDITSNTIESLEENGYIFFVKYTDYSGIYINNSFTCTTDTDDYNRIEKNRTWNKAARLIRIAMLPYVNSPITVNESGQIDSVTIAAMEAAGNKAIRPMFQAGEISGPDPLGSTPPFTIDPNQNILANPNIDAKLSIIPRGVAETITNYIGFTNPNN